MVYSIFSFSLFNLCLDREKRCQSFLISTPRTADSITVGMGTQPNPAVVPHFGSSLPSAPPSLSIPVYDETPEATRENARQTLNQKAFNELFGLVCYYPGNSSNPTQPTSNNGFNYRYGEVPRIYYTVRAAEGTGPSALPQAETHSRP